MSINSIISTIQSNSEQLKSFGVTKVGIFGSVVHGESKPESDIDILIEFRKGEKSFRNFMNTSFLLEDVLKKKIDLVTSSSISPYIRPYIDKDIKYVQI